jgi:hypothetical protein
LNDAGSSWRTMACIAPVRRISRAPPPA